MNNVASASHGTTVVAEFVRHADFTGADDL